MSLPAYQTRVRKLISTIIDMGYQVRVHDGEEFATPMTADKQTTYAALFSTDEDYVYIYSLSTDAASNKRQGWFRCVYDGPDMDADEVIADYSATDVCETIYRKVQGDN